MHSKRDASDEVRVERGRAVTDRLRADTYRRPDADDAPVVAFVYGGGWESGARGQFSRWALDAAGQRPESRRTEFGDATDEGFVACEVEYRLSDEATFPAQIRDVRRCLSWVRANADSFGGDPARVAVVGHSAGAHLALLAALAPTGAFGGAYDPEPTVDAAVGIGGAYDLREDDAAEVRQFLGGGPSERPDRYAAASPVTHVSRDAPPTFLLHGEDDDVVPVASSREMASSLAAAGAPVELRTDAGGDHVYLHSSYWYPALREAVFSWLAETL